MKYKHFGPCNDLDSLYDEIRINIIRVNNEFCSNSCEEVGVWCLDLFDMFNDPTVDVSSIVDLALQLEGLAEALEDEPENVHWRALKDIANQLEEAMIKLG